MPETPPKASPVPTALPAPQPSPPNQKAEEDVSAKTVVVQVLDNNQLKINEENATWDTLGSRLNDIFKLRAEKVTIVDDSALGDFDISIDDGTIGPKRRTRGATVP